MRWRVPREAPERFAAGTFCFLALLGAAILSWQLGGSSEREAANLQAALACGHVDAPKAADICAQWAAARAAERAAFWAMLSFYLATVGTAGLVLTLYLTSRSVSAAVAAAEAANAQVDTARDTARRQLRPYVSVQKGRVNGFKAGSKPIYCAELRNNGQTPAYHCRRRYDVIMTSENPDRLRVRFEDVSEASDIGPSHERTAYYKSDYSLTAAEVQRFKEGKLAPVFAGVVSYVDAFGQTHRNVFKLCLKPHMLDSKGSGLLTLCAKNNSSN